MAISCMHSEEILHFVATRKTEAKALTCGGKKIMASRKLTSTFNMIVGAGKATPQPPVGSALGQRGLKLMDFCKDFNDRTSIYKENVPIQCKVKSYSDRTFTFDIFHPKTSYFLKKCAGVEKGANSPGHEIVAKVSVKQVYDIALLKMQDIEKKESLRSLRAMARGIVGTAAGMGIRVYNPDAEKKK